MSSEIDIPQMPPMFDDSNTSEKSELSEFYQYQSFYAFSVYGKVDCAVSLNLKQDMHKVFFLLPRIRLITTIIRTTQVVFNYPFEECIKLFGKLAQLFFQTVHSIYPTEPWYEITHCKCTQKLPKRIQKHHKIATPIFAVFPSKGCLTYHIIY
ncbi:hypothetical protein Cgig2_033183 [Carnegiea gigantea]|uniref:Uncharacterized protein n=1 Tax=Carnegiea gigantea TaxID=171969 RepID=A0A9Q1Q7S7_9CARY|nr:hypothetical protein Cgig2_033183 [Carnegiea gigantea]